MADRATLPVDDDTGPRRVVGTEVEVGDGDVVRPPSRDPLIPEGMPESVPVPVRSLILQKRVFMGLSVLLFALVVGLFVDNRGLRQAEAAREDVLEAGRRVAARVTTYQGASIDEWLADTQALATGSYAEEIAQLFDPVVREGLAANEVDSTGVIENAFVQRIDGDSARVFLVVRQEYTAAGAPVVSDELRMDVDLSLVDGQWLAADVAVLGPSVVTPLDQAEDGATTEDETG